MMAHRPQTSGNQDDVTSRSVELEGVDHQHSRIEKKSRSGKNVVLSGELLDDDSKTTSGFIV